MRRSFELLPHWEVHCKPFTDFTGPMLRSCRRSIQGFLRWSQISTDLNFSNCQGLPGGINLFSEWRSFSDAVPRHQIPLDTGRKRVVALGTGWGCSRLARDLNTRLYDLTVRDHVPGATPAAAAHRIPFRICPSVYSWQCGYVQCCGSVPTNHLRKKCETPTDTSRRSRYSGIVGD